jgi:hypothetical protein
MTDVFSCAAEAKKTGSEANNVEAKAFSSIVKAKKVWGRS